MSNSRRNLLAAIAALAAVLLVFAVVAGALIILRPTSPHRAPPVVAEVSSSEPARAEESSELPVLDAAPPARAVTVLQIGDSHTARGYFTGRVRSVLEKQFGAGGVYLPPGIPRRGIRPNVFAVEASEGWTYDAMTARPKDGKEDFWLSGFRAAANGAGATITYTSVDPVSFDAIDVSFLSQPDGGTADILLDGEVADQVDLKGEANVPVLRRLQPADAKLGDVKTLMVRATSAGTVTLTSVLVHQTQSGVSYLSAGYPSAQIVALQRVAAKNLLDDMTRLAPDIVVLSFGTFEGLDDKLDIADYKQQLTQTIQDILATRAGMKLVLIGPPPAARQEDSCAGVPLICNNGEPSTSTAACWAVPLKLDQVRETQKQVATDLGQMYWDWSAVLPSSCALEAETLPPDVPYAEDRVTITNAGYRAAGSNFAAFLKPVIAALQKAP